MSNPEVFRSFLYENSSLIFIETDAEGIIIEANKYAKYLYGKELKGALLRDFIIDFSGTLDFESFAKDTGNKKMLNVTTASGLPQTFYFTFYPAGDHLMIFGESNSLEVEGLRQSFVAINGHLNNLTRELQKKNVMLEKLNDQKNEFLGMAAHDLRNPIGVIMGYSEFILDEAEGRLPESHIQFIRIILASSEFMLKMLNDLLDIAKIESGKLNLLKDWFRLEKTIANNVALNRIISEKKNIKIRVEIFEELPRIFADADKLEQVLNNLISNAIKFSNPGSTIIVSAFRVKNEVTVSVKDQGLGIKPEEQERLFQPFSKISTKSTGGEKSTGLGLSITKKIILGHSGKIWVESALGVGTTFSFSLPIGAE